MFLPHVKVVWAFHQYLRQRQLRNVGCGKGWAPPFCLCSLYSAPWQLCLTLFFHITN